MEQLLQLEASAILLATFNGILLLLVIYLAWKVSNVERRYRLFMSGSTATSLEQRLIDYHQEMVDIRAQLGEVSRRLTFVEQAMPECLQRVGMVRYNAFNDVGSDLSFALALLNEQGDGAILSSLYARDETRIFAKPVEKGLSSYRLTEEEQKAVNKALAQ